MHISLFTPDEDWSHYAWLWTARADLYANFLAPHGIVIEPRPWPTAAPDQPALALLSWGYHNQPARWRSRLQDWPADVPLLNPASVLLWNTDKSYLGDLATAGVPTVPTRFAAIADEQAVAEAREAFGTDELVVKPRISAAADNTRRLGRGGGAPRLADAMIQPFLPSVQTQGELSIFFFNGRRAHAVRKVAAAGDFRVQREYGGAFTPVDPNAEEVAVAQAALACAPELPLYARADLVPGLNGSPQMMELEMIEPDLYLDLAPDGGTGFAAATADRLRAT